MAIRRCSSRSGGTPRAAVLAFVTCAAIVLTAARPSRTLAASTTWTNSTGNSLWSDPLNWSAGVPTANTDVALALGGSNTINLGGATRIAGNVAMTGLENAFRLINGTLDATGISSVGSLDGIRLDCDLTSSRGMLSLGDATRVNGAIRGGGFSLVITGSAELNGANTYTGETLVNKNGSLHLVGSIAQESVIRLRGGMSTSAANSISAAARVRLEGGSWSAYAPAQAGILEFAGGTARVFADNSTFNIATITVGTVTRQLGSTGQFGISPFGPITIIAGVRVMTTLPPMFGDGASSERLPILPWATAQYGYPSGVPDASFVTYDRGANPSNPNDDVGFRVLRDGSGEYASTPVDGANVKLTSTTALAGAWTPNSLTLKSTSLTLGAAGGDVTLASGAVLFLPGTTAQASIQAPAGSTAALTAPGEMVLLAFGSNSDEYNFSHPHYLVDAPLRADSLTVSGGGTLELFRSNSFPNGVHVIDTAVVLHDIRGLGSSAVDLGQKTYGARLWIPNPNQMLTNDLILHENSGNQLSVPSTGVTTWTGRVGGGGTLTIAFGALRMIGDDNGIDAYHLRMGGGTVIIDGSYTSRNATLNVGTSPRPAFFGNGTFLGTFLPGGGTVSAGSGGGSVGRLTLGTSNWSSATLREEINGAAPASGYDQIVVLDALSFDISPGKLNTLEVLFGSSFTPSIGDSFVIFDNRFDSAVSGCFAGLPEGATFSAGGSLLQISYIGGNGNDVVLTAVIPEPTSLATLIAISTVTTGRWRRVRFRSPIIAR